MDSMIILLHTPCLDGSNLMIGMILGIVLGTIFGYIVRSVQGDKNEESVSQEKK